MSKTLCKNWLLLFLGPWTSVGDSNTFLRFRFKIPSGNKILPAEKIVKLLFAYQTLEIAKFTELTIMKEQILLKFVH